MIYWAQLAALVPIFIFLAFGNAALCFFVAAGLGVLTVLSMILGISTMGMGAFYDRRTDPDGFRSAVKIEIFASVAALAVAIFKTLQAQEKHLHRYLSEQDFRYNNRVALGVDDEARAVKALKGVVGKRLTYETVGSANG